MKDADHLPIETAILVPSTQKGDKPISATAYQTRINQVRRWLSNHFGGYTSIKAIGGYVSNQKGLIKEKVTVVTSYAKKDKYKKHKKAFLKYVKKIGKKWGQESIGIIIENDMYYINT